MSVEEIFERQRKKSFELRLEKVSDRKKRVKKILDWTLANQHKIIEAVGKDLSKPVTEAKISEIFTVVTEARHILSNLRAWWSEERTDSPLPLIGSSSRIIREPKGTCLIISPWNFPYNLTVIPLMSCLAAGNNAIIKPSEYSPATSDLLSEMITELFTPEEVYVEKGDHITAGKLLELPFDHIFFTGSPQIGKIVMTAAAKHLSGITLELGGKNPVFVAPDAKIKDVARKVIWAKYMNCGQSCVSPDYVIVHESQEKDLLEEMGKQVHALYSDGTDAESYGRIIGPRHFDRLISLLDSSVSDGCSIVTGGKHSRDDLFISPTIVCKVKWDSDLMKDEIFGPILPVLTYTDFDNALQNVLKLPKPLASYIFTGSNKTFEKVKKLLSAGVLIKNDLLLHFVNPQVPFGGVNFSGMGKSHGIFGFREFVNEKPVIKQLRGSGTTLFFHPPFNKLKRAIVDLLIRWF